MDKGIHKVKLVVKQGKISLDAFEFDAAVEATGLQITGADSLNMNASKTLQLEAVYTPEGAAGAGVDWSVDKQEVATIDANGLLTAVKAGTVVVTATDKENEKLTATKTITITKEATTVKYDDRDSSIKYDANWTKWDEEKHYNGQRLRRQQMVQASHLNSTEQALACM
ncbi:MAG: Ig domain-containing protein [[Clostridium] nexile]